MSLTCFEALYGGAAGGGKSDALLVDAIRGVGRGHGRNYSALILRREFPDLEMSLMRRAFTLYPRLGGRWHGTQKTWTFPKGETVRFGHVQYENDVHQYQGAEFQFIGFDELTTFTHYQYTYLISRMRSSSGVRCRMRATTNPGGNGHEWVFKRFAPWIDPTHEDPAAPGEVRYFKPDAEGKDVRTAKGAKGALGRVFVPARLADNPHLADDGEYATKLEQLDVVTKARLRDGDWLIQPAKGLYFKRASFDGRFVDVAPRNARRIRYWDRAATEDTGHNDPDWTVGTRIAIADDGRIFIEDVVRLRGNPGTVEATIKATAELDGREVTVGLSRDPGAAGKFESSYYTRALQGFNVIAEPESGDKITRAGPISSQVLAGNVYVVRGPWNDAWVRELEQFPEGAHDDQVDSLSGGHALLVSRRQPSERHEISDYADAEYDP